MAKSNIAEQLANVNSMLEQMATLGKDGHKYVGLTVAEFGQMEIDLRNRKAELELQAAELAAELRGEFAVLTLS